MGCERTQSSFSQSVGLGSGGSGARRRWVDGGWAAGPPTRQSHSSLDLSKHAPTPACQQHQQARRGANHDGDALGWIRALARGGRRGARRRARGPGGRLGKPADALPPTLRPRSPNPGALGPTGRIFARNRERKQARKIAPGGGARRLHSSFGLPPHARAATRRPAHTPRARPAGGGGGGAARREEGRGKKGAGGGGRSPRPERACGLGASRLLARVLIRRGGRPVCRWPVCLRGAHHARAGRRGAE